MTTICKRLLLALAAAAIAGAVHATDTTKELPIGEIGEAFTVSVSTSAWTKIQGSNTRVLARRVGLKISNPATNNATMVGVLSAGTPSEATTIRPIEIQIGENPFVPAGSGIDLYLMSLNTSAENVHAQEVQQ